MLTYFTNDETATEETVTLKLNGNSAECYSLFLLDEAHDAENMGAIAATDGEITVSMTPNSVILLEN